MALNHPLHFWHSFANHHYETQHVVSIMRFIISKPQGWQKVISVCLDMDVYSVHTEVALHGLNFIQVSRCVLIRYMHINVSPKRF